MKRTIMLISSATAVLLMIGSCKKPNETNSTATNLEVATMVSGSLAANSNGLSNISVDAVANAQATVDLNPGCGATKTYSFTRQNPQGSTTTYNYTFNYSYTLNCNASNQPDNVTITATDKGSFDGPRLTSNNSGSLSAKIGGLTTASQVFVLSGEYKRAGTYTSKVDNKTSGSSTVDLVVTGVTLNKTTKIITAGTATFTVTGATASNVAINTTGSLVFSGSNKATLTINSVNYIIDLLTGEVTKA
ncbi:hypothetical protein C8P68_103108 [Mucilaginibacter yixingensis]|uniref:Lipoprotein n=1 Tax=Mucilaginibacter yixingensis TaxID=1295612 RepID=A0A2T5JAZ3_9SPHI|nr:hypothetical protein [Mucilaginibacter yixingensis]PTQ97949.1 hypothetical protein C8P68_103108 [Mucilaginibacter yixingensis]